MKRILIFSHAMELGGAERALLGLLETIDTTEYQVDLFLMRHDGELMAYIPKNIHLLPETPQYSCLAVPFKTVLKKKQLGMALGRLSAKIASKKRIRQLGLPSDNDVELQLSHKYTLPFVPMINKQEYDLAISFLTPHYFVAEKVKAKKKIAWIHTDYSTVAIDKTEQLAMWDQYDWIASISEAVSKSFTEIFPDLKRKLVLLPNIMPMRYMEEQTNAFDAKEEMPDDGSIKLLSIGRFCAQKNFDNVPDICRQIREAGLNVKWYIIGFGGDEPLIGQKIEQAGMREYVIVLGKKSNPYPYIKACDLYVQPSRYEGKCVSVIEAQILHKPVIITNYATSASQLIDGVDGVIAPMDNANCARSIVRILKDEAMLERIVQGTKNNDYTNRGIIKKVYKLLES